MPKKLLIFLIMLISTNTFCSEEKSDSANYAEELRQWLKNRQVSVHSFKDCPECPEMVNIPAGSFMMGSNNGEANERPVHRVEVAAFAIGKYEVTFDEYDVFAKATGRKLPNDQSWGRGKRPVINVSWLDAVAYTQWLSQKTLKTYRLPTEAEWEYAARAGTTTERFWGNNPDDACEFANISDEIAKRKLQQQLGWKNLFVFGWKTHKCTDGYGFSSPVGLFKPNVFGLYDMLGNVWELMCPKYTERYDGHESICTDIKGEEVIIRGGSHSTLPQGVRSAYRAHGNVSEVDKSVGFRVVSSTSQLTQNLRTEICDLLIFKESQYCATQK